MPKQLKPEYATRRFRNDSSIVEVRLHPDGSVSAHYQGVDGRTYDNVPNIVKPGETTIDMAGLHRVAVRPIGLGFAKEIEELQNMMAEAINELLGITTLRDKGEDHDGEVRVIVNADKDFIAIGPAGYGENGAADGHGTPVLLELYEGSLRVIAFNDINEADPVIIDMEGARETNRKDAE